MSQSIHKQILAINLYKFSGDEIGELKKQTYKLSYLSRLLPEYCLNDKGYITRTDYYLQFIVSGKEYYYLFDVMYEDQLLGEEISNVSLGSIIEEYDYRPLFNQLKAVPAKNYNMHFGDYQRIVFRLVYTCYEDHYGGGYDWDSEITLEGYLDNNLQIIEIKTEN